MPVAASAAATSIAPAFSGHSLEVELHRQLTDTATIVAEDHAKVSRAIIEVPVHSSDTIELRMVEDVEEFRAEFCRRCRRYLHILQQALDPCC